MNLNARAGSSGTRNYRPPLPRLVCERLHKTHVRYRPGSAIIDGSVGDTDLDQNSHPKGTSPASAGVFCCIAPVCLLMQHLPPEAMRKTNVRKCTERGMLARRLCDADESIIDSHDELPNPAAAGLFFTGCLPVAGSGSSIASQRAATRFGLSRTTKAPPRVGAPFSFGQGGWGSPSAGEPKNSPRTCWHGGRCMR